MMQIAIYGKGGIGKSTVTSNISAALSLSGKKVLQVGCDPKADSTLLLCGGKEVPAVLDLIRERGNDFTLSDMTATGFGGVLCAEAGGPAPGSGCAGRGIIAALEKLKEKGAYDTFAPDAMLYDVLGDVVCGGFTLPMRPGYAERVFIVTSGENMSMHAAANIAAAIEGFRGRGYASLGGLILNRRGIKEEDARVEELAARLNTRIIGRIDRSELVAEADALGKTVLEAFPESELAAQYRALAYAITEDTL